MLTDFITDKSRDKAEQWVVMGNSIGGLLALMLTERLQDGRKVRDAYRIVSYLFPMQSHRKHPTIQQPRKDETEREKRRCVQQCAVGAGILLGAQANSGTEEKE